MKKDFDIIDLDQTDTIPVVRDDYTEEEILQEEYIYTEENYIEEDSKSEYAQAEEIPDEDYEAEAMDSSAAAEGYEEIDESYPEEHMESVQDGLTESSQAGFGEETYSEEEYTGEYADEYIEENAYEYTENFREDLQEGYAEEYIAAEESGEEYIGIDEENAGSEVFQGEVSVDTILMSDISEEINEQAGEYTGTLDFVDIDEISEEPYDDSEEYEDEEEAENSSAVGKFAIFKEKILDFFSNFTAGDWVTAGMGVLILCVAIVTLAMWGRGGKVVEAVNMYDVGQGFSSIGIAGESGLLAMADAQMAVPMEEEVEEDAEVISVEVTFTSVDRDLKIKFINTESDRLITDVIFEIVLTDNSGKEYTFRDEDVDGIIYDKTIAPGEYQVSITPMEGYEFVEFPETVTVKDHIVYEQIDVTQEIKSESEINAAVEDTAGNNAEAEAEAETAPAVTDTVEWVESTRTPVDGSDGYRQINKDTITEPSYSARNTISVASEQMAAGVPMQRYFIMDVLFRTDITPYTVSGDSVSGNTTPDEGKEETETPTPEHKDITANITISGAKEMTVGGDTITLTASASADGSSVSGGTYTWSSTGGVSISSSGSSCVITAKQAGNATITVEFKKEDGETTYTGKDEVTIHVSEKEEEKVTVTSVTVNPTTLELAVSANRVISANAVMSDNTKVTSASSFTFVSDTPTVATVDATGKVVGVSAGTAKITVTYKDSEGNEKSAVCTVTVKLQTVQSIALNTTSISLTRGSTETLTATVTLSDGTKITDAGKMTWKSSNTGVVTVDAAGKITAVATGTAKITVTYKDSSGNTKSVECTVTVVANPADDTTSRLVDKDGNQVYVKDSSGNYVPATFADYYKASAFYVQSDVEYIYTGWQTINGNVYYYDKNHNKVTGDQIIQGIKYHFTEEGILAMNNSGVMGIDVSKWNGTIDWNAVKNSGVSFVIIRCGYRGSATGVLVEDPNFRRNIQGATAAGLKVGVYFFTQAVNEVEAVEEASMVLSLIKGYGLSYPIFIDTERTESGNGRADRLDRATRTAVCKAFCETIRNAGYSAGVYASKSWFNDNLNYGTLSGYRIWLAQYASEPTFGSRYDMWQYTSTGTVSGISGKVDMNISYLGY